LIKNKFSMEKLDTKIIIREIFYFLTIFYLVLIFLEILFPNIVLAYFNLNYLFLLIVLFGVFSLTKK